MSFSLAHVRSCLDVTAAVVAQALQPARTVADVTPREKVFALLDRMAEVARPKQGAAKILLVLARVARCDWLDGDLELAVIAEGEGTSIQLHVNDGLSLIKLRPAVHVPAPYDEFRRAVQQKPELVAPLCVQGHPGSSRMRLVAPGACGTEDQDVRAAPAEAPSRPVIEEESSAVLARIPLKRVAVPAPDASSQKRPSKRAPEKLPSTRRTTATDERAARRELERTASGRPRSGSTRIRSSVTPPGGSSKPPRDPGSGRR